jgi:hypothetical protein
VSVQDDAEDDDDEDDEEEESSEVGFLIPCPKIDFLEDMYAYAWSQFARSDLIIWRYSQVSDKRTWSVAQKALRLAGSFAYRNAIVQYTDRPSRETTFANWDVANRGKLSLGA